MSLHSPLARPLAGALAVFVGTTLAAPAFAARPTPRPLSTAVAARLATLPAAAIAQATPEAPAVAVPASDRPFLRTARGRVAIALLAGAIGYTLYSFSHDRVKSPAR